MHAQKRLNGIRKGELLYSKAQKALNQSPTDSTKADAKITTRVWPSNMATRTRAHGWFLPLDMWIQIKRQVRQPSLTPHLAPLSIQVSIVIWLGLDQLKETAV